MKIYIQNVELTHINDLLNSNNLYIIKSHKNDIYSNEGIFTINKNNIYKLDIIQNDAITIHDYLDKYTILIDHSSITPFKNYEFHIPTPNFSHNYTEYLIQTNKDSPITLVILVDSHKIHDWYFKTNESIDNPFIKDSINKLISYIK